MPQRPSAHLIAAPLVALLLLAACGGDSSTADAESPISSAADPWAEIERGFTTACTDGGDEATADYCRCVFTEVVEFYGTPEAFSAAEQAVAIDPDTLDPRLDAAFAGCADLHLVTP